MESLEEIRNLRQPVPDLILSKNILPNAVGCQRRDRLDVEDRMLPLELLLDQHLLGVLQRARFVCRKQQPVAPPVHHQPQNSQR